MKAAFVQSTELNGLVPCSPCSLFQFVLGISRALLYLSSFSSFLCLILSLSLYFHIQNTFPSLFSLSFSLFLSLSLSLSLSLYLSLSFFFFFFFFFIISLSLSLSPPTIYVFIFYQSLSVSVFVSLYLSV